MTDQDTSKDEGCGSQSPKKSYPHRLCLPLHSLQGVLGIATCIAVLWRVNLSMGLLLGLAVSAAGGVVLACWITPKFEKAESVRSVTAPPKPLRRWASVACVTDIALVLVYGLLLGRWLFLDNVAATGVGAFVSLLAVALFLGLIAVNVIAHIRASVKTA
ncbi:MULTISPECIES: hypothetical protein [Streptomyces]|uniref:hypothetical protein n=1 Tax=Streptomyces TaxID=1883 RepID=UPI002F9179F4